MPKQSAQPIGTIRPEDAMTTPIVWSELSPEKKKVFGTMIDMYLAWARSVPEIIEMVEEAKKVQAKEGP